MWTKGRAGPAGAFVLVGLVAVAPALAQQTYKDVVALQNRALELTPLRIDEAIQDHTKSLRIAQGLGRPGLVAVLFKRLGEVLESAGLIQDAVIAYETGLKALAADQLAERRTVVQVDEAAVSGARVVGAKAAVSNARTLASKSSDTSPASATAPLILA